MAFDASARDTLLTGRRRTAMTLAGLGAVLAFLAAVALGGAWHGGRSAERLARSADLASAYLRTQDAISREDTIEDRYKDDPAPRLRGDFDRAAGDLDAALAVLERAGGPSDRALARRAAPLHAEYADAMRSLFDAADAGDEERAEAINDERADPAQDELQPLINGAGPAYALAQLREVDAMARSQRAILRATLVAVPVALAIYLLVLALFAAQRRRADRAARAEVTALRAALDEDHLTGLRNHRAFHDDLDRAVRVQAGLHALAVLDLVGLKALNDTEGHAAGDERVRAVARRLTEAVEGRGRAYRIGADDFAVLLPDHGAMAALALVDAVRADLEADGHGRLRAGIAEGPLVSGKAELLRRSDLSLAAARRTGRPVTVYAADLEYEREERGARGAAVNALTAALAQAVDAKDPYTRSHSETVSTVAALVAVELGLAPERVARVRLAGLMHDVGKIGIPDAVLNKPGRLDAREWEIMRSHAALGHDILAAAGLEAEAEWVLHHHERVDGGGYPDGLHDEEVPLESRIILAADTFEAITSDRSYRRGRSEAEALEELRRHAGTQFDPACVAALEAVLGARAGQVEAHLVAAG